MNNLCKSKATTWSPWWPSVCVRWTTQVSPLPPAYIWSCKTIGWATFSTTCKNISRDLLWFYLFGILSIKAFYLILYLPCLNFPSKSCNALKPLSNVSFQHQKCTTMFPQLRPFCFPLSFGKENCKAKGVVSMLYLAATMHIHNLDLRNWADQMWHSSATTVRIYRHYCLSIANEVHNSQ